MLWTSALAIFLLFWWLCLFFVLPFHGRRAGDEGDGHVAGTEPGAPPRVRLARIALQTTVAAAILFGAYYALYTSGMITPQRLGLPAPPPR